MVYQIFSDLMFIIIIPCVYYIERSKRAIVDDVPVIIYEHSLVMGLISFYFYFQLISCLGELIFYLKKNINELGKFRLNHPKTTE